MTDEIRAAIDRELPAGRVGFAFDTNAAVRAGRRARNRRRAAGAGAAVLSVAAGVAVVVVLPVGTTGTTTPPDQDLPVATGAPATPATSAPSVAQPPELDPEADYYWGGDIDPQQTEATRRYTDEFWSYVTDQYPGAELVDMDPAGQWREQPGPPAELAWFAREEQVLQKGSFDEGGAPVGDHEYVLERTRYSLIQLVHEGRDGEGPSGAATIRFPGRGQALDTIDVDLLPAGSYRRDGPGALHPSGCHTGGPYTGGMAACEVEDATGPDGEDLQFVTGMVQDDGAEPVASVYFAVHYRPDGSAVVVSDSVSRLREEEPAPYLSFEELARIAAALPDLPVR